LRRQRSAARRKSFSAASRLVRTQLSETLSARIASCIAEMMDSYRKQSDPPSGAVAVSEGSDASLF